MSFVEIDILGVYVSPMAVMVVAAYLLLVIVRWVGLKAGLFRWIWHPALFQFSVYVLILSSMVLIRSTWRMHV